MASPACPTKRLAGVPTPAAECDDILRQIFIRLNSPADLARACTASPAFRRVITDPHFLCRFRDLHPPPLLGILNHDFLPAEPPHRSAAAVRKLRNDSNIDFSCKSFLPSPDSWFLRDSRDGRILYSSLCDVAQKKESCCGIHRDMGRPLAVCDPLHRRYLVLQVIPDELATLVDHGDWLKGFTAFLAPPAEEGGGSTTPSFRVMCVAHSETRVVLFVFSSSGVGGRQWRGINFDNWSGLMMDNNHRGFSSFRERSYVHGRFYWPMYPGKLKLLVLDVRGITPVFSTMKFPTHTRKFFLAFVEVAGEQERVAAVTAYKHKGEHVYHLQYAVLQDDSGDRWEAKARINLPSQYSFYHFIGVAGGYLLLKGTLGPDIVCFSLDLWTLQLDRFCGSKYDFNIRTSLYAGCPSYLSPPTV